MWCRDLHGVSPFAFWKHSTDEFKRFCAGWPTGVCVCVCRGGWGSIFPFTVTFCFCILRTTIKRGHKESKRKIMSLLTCWNNQAGVCVWEVTRRAVDRAAPISSLYKCNWITVNSAFKCFEMLRVPLFFFIAFWLIYILIMCLHPRGLSPIKPPVWEMNRIECGENHFWNVITFKFRFRWWISFQ